MRLTKNQLFVLIVIFEIGSTTLFSLGVDILKQDAWWAISLAFLFGFALLWGYTSIQKNFYNHHWGEILTSIFNKWIAKFLIFLYAFYYIYISSHNLFEFSTSFVSTILISTPISIVMGMIVLLIIYICTSLNVMILARTAEFMLPIFLMFILSIFVLVLLSKGSKIDNLLPLLEHSSVDILNTALFKILNFPFGEMIVFLMFWNLVTDKDNIPTISFYAFFISGLFIICSNIIIITVLGSAQASIASIPMFNVIQKINIGNFITRLDSLGITLLFIGGFYKIVLHFYAGLMLLQSLSNIFYRKSIIIISCIIFYGFTYFHFPNVIFQRWIGFTILIPYVHMPFQILIPGIVLLIIMRKYKFFV